MNEQIFSGAAVDTQIDPNLQLRLHQGGSSISEISVSKFPAVIGRDGDADVGLSGLWVGRQHAEIQLKINIPIVVTALVLDEELKKIYVELDKNSYIYMGTGEHFGSIWMSAKDETGAECIVKYQDSLMDYLELLFSKEA